MWLRLDHGDALPTKVSAYLLHKLDAVYNITAGANTQRRCHHAKPLFSVDLMNWSSFTGRKESKGLYYQNRQCVLFLLHAGFPTRLVLLEGVLLLTRHSGNCAEASGVKGFKSHG